MKKNYKMVVQYDGTRYDRWQRQGNTENMIQFKLESMIEKMTGGDVEIIGFGRADVGMHATGQMVNVHMDTEKASRETRGYVNQYLPDDIAATQLEEVPGGFHSRLNVAGRVYIYWTKMAPKCPVFQRKYIYILGQKLDVEVMRQAARLLCGIHDSKSFCSNKNTEKSTMRTVKTISAQERGSGLETHTIGDGFLCNMVQILVGTLIEVGLGGRMPDSAREIPEAKNRQAARATAPACGLFLTAVMYDGWVIEVE